MKLKPGYSIKLRYFEENEPEPWLADLYYEGELVVNNELAVHGHGATPEDAVAQVLVIFEAIERIYKTSEG